MTDDIKRRSWTPEQRAKQAEIIRQWQPWTKSTGAKTQEGKARVARNADKGKSEYRKTKEYRESVAFSKSSIARSLGVPVSLLPEDLFEIKKLSIQIYRSFKHGY